MTDEISTDEISFTQYRSTIPRLQPEAKEKWIDGLLNRFAGKQGKNKLQTPDRKFCCLGVWCEVANVPNYVVNIEMAPDAPPVLQPYYGKIGADSASFIPPSYEIPLQGVGEEGHAVFFGGETVFESLHPVTGGMEPWTLTMLNDEGLTFPQIADIIRYFL
jgi:hypothetical protein